MRLWEEISVPAKARLKTDSQKFSEKYEPCLGENGYLGWIIWVLFLGVYILLKEKILLETGKKLVREILDASE